VRKVILLLVLVTFVAGLVLIASDNGFAAWGKKKDDVGETVAEAAEEAPAAPEPEAIYSFKGEEEMGEFEQLYFQAGDIWQDGSTAGIFCDGAE